MCDAYGKNQSLYGKITISDTSTDEFVYTDQIDNLPYMSNGADVNENQHIVCVNLDKSYCDLESVYSTTDGYLQSSQIVEFSTLFESSKYMVYASYYTNTNPEDDSDYVFPYNVCGTLTDDSFDDFIDRIDHRSLYDINYTPSNKNYFLTLSVDSDFMENSKFVVLCIKLDDSENFSKITSATDNPSVHYQQKWYDQQNLQNPYRFSSKWYPEIYLPDSVKTTQLSQEDFT
jgi:hypothetical protein